ncbi:hypothetical protein CP04DC42_0564 [Chlamydia psittaci 04DC42]|uniref:Uncharacterized protein n=1 Tax=Chlamydia psittaci 99DC5 TaxID=1112251 RepID=A0ABN0MP82_CHLPS|nr:hypothetical protein CPS0C_0160 [Chlamydia psittaci C19/98]AEG86175.1 hypothetical protein CPS0A_0162 [Chlamydia psittaci 01DC11]AEG87149.1 hypothetical protein CPS0B_0160 [Chlamydia psittaci 02DC15]AEG88128.1 hypothetical protein CPS0D_0158 [Chlamydia psittaci 08DC60]AFS19138.1 hypothetical protein B595_0162 [Chlamydia psittaci 84/55]AFS21991.1 hypothetical protein B599_0159 [Chlamydia psittaci MN]AFS22337.1 hypothetical protein B600_0167 [Chlamydia psittaci VS225]AFS23307.1 hypothetical
MFRYLEKFAVYLGILLPPLRSIFIPICLETFLLFSIFGSLCLSDLKIHKLKNHSASSQSPGDVMRSLSDMDR